MAKKIQKSNNFENLSFCVNNMYDVLNENTDPDRNFYTENINTHYYTLDSFKSNFVPNSKHSISILHINIRSMSRNYEDFKVLLSELGFEFKIICLTETWCKNTNQFNIENYKTIHQYRNNNKIGGGICLFVHDSLVFKERYDLCNNTSDCETLSIEIIQDKRNININTVYRPPSGNITQFMNQIKKCLEESNKKTVYLVGDLNLNSLEYNTNNKVKNAFDMFFQSNLIPLINKPTRVTKRSASIIDHILTNNLNLENTNSGIIKCDVTDHFPVFFIENSTLNDKLKENSDTVFVRKFNQKSVNNFHDFLKNSDWSFLYNFTDPDSAYNYFLRLFTTAYENHFPKCKTSQKTSKGQSPWITRGLLKSSKKKQRLYEKFLKKRTSVNEEKYKIYKNMFNCLKLKAKKAYYSERIKKSSQNIKEQWNVINEMMGKTKLKTTNLPQRLIVGDESVTEKLSIAEKFNEFFVKVGPNLASSLPASSKDHLIYINNNESSIGEVEELTDEELYKALKTLKPNKSAGFDEINVNVVLQVIELIFKPLKFIYNLSLQCGIFPQNLKIAKVIPLYKKGDRTEVSNYRPISILPCFSKILERIIYNRLYSYIETHDLLDDRQFGFQAKHSTDHALLQFVQDINDNFDKNMYTVAVFIDLSKAFDTVNHKILISKLKKYGVNGTYLKLFSDYLSTRKQFVSDGNFKTSFKYVECGVPQGSILGPLLFLLYINDMKHCSTILKFILFADDTTLYISNESISSLFITLNTELSKLDEWFKANKLSLNVKKTKYSFFHKSKSTDSIPLKLPDLAISNIKLEREKNIKFLGVMINENLKWNKHIKTIENKISKSIGIIYRIRQFLDFHSLKLLYFSHIHSQMNYANIVWGSVNKTALNSLYIKQKNACRVILRTNKLTPSRPLFQEIHALNIFQLNIYNVLVFMYRIKNKTAPKIFNTLFSDISHKYSTRSSGISFTTTKLKSKRTGFKISYRGTFLWNRFYKSINDPTKSSFSSFKKQLKIELISNRTDEQLYF